MSNGESADFDGSRSRLTPLLLFGSGFCALVYQTVWLREFRMVFGSSTAANAAVLSIFMAGLGSGGLVLGRRVDRKPRPLRYYAQLEFAIALFACITPFLLWFTRTVYLAIGGSDSIGKPGAMVLRLFLAGVVLGVPTFLMGGTLPAAARAAETNTDTARRNLGLLYGINTLGAVLGVFLSTFYLLEFLGNRRTLWLGCVINLIVALAAFALARSFPARDATSELTNSDAAHYDATAPIPFVIAAAGLAGFVFFLMELTWYRMMTPLLGGTAFTFGLILAVALLGIGVGGVLYSWFAGQSQPSLGGFALTCAAESFFIAAPFAIGDRIALLTLLLRPLGALGFHGHVLAWTVITALVVFPASVAAGIQFPLLIALLGRGRNHVGSHTGVAYAFNTAGAIAGAMAGGFGLLPALSATGVWKLSGLLVASLGFVACILSVRVVRFHRTAFASALALTFSSILMLVIAPGPTAAWRQSPIGAGREETASVMSPNSAEEWLRSKRRWISHQEDGIESCLGIEISSGLAFVINGKPDGHAVLDAGTQVMLGLLGAALHPDPTRALVVGLGTGSTAGWLADIPSMEQVDVIELEPAVLKVAELCAPVNRNILSNSKARITIGDAREKLLTSRDQYDLIVSEPSNPYRAGVSSLYTKEYYEAASRRLRPNGLFVQWVQAYEIDASTVHSIYATLASAFPVVETWQTNRLNLAFVAGKDAIHYDADTLRKRINQQPFRDALANAWRVGDIEGFLGHFVANDAFTKTVVSFAGVEPNTDDQNAVEFGFARRVGSNAGFNVPMLRAAAHQRGQDRPQSVVGEINWERVDDESAQIDLGNGTRPQENAFLNPDQRQRLAAETAWTEGNGSKVMELWRTQPRPPDNLIEWTMIAQVLADSGNEEAGKYIDKIGLTNPNDASLLRSILRARQGKFEEATSALESVYVSCRTNPWPMLVLLKNSFQLAGDIASQDETGLLATRLYDALEKPFVVNLAEADRRWGLAQVGSCIDRHSFSERTRKVIASFEPNVPWEREFLQTRRACYRALSDPLAGKAELDLARFLKNDPPPLDPQSPPND